MHIAHSRSFHTKNCLQYALSHCICAAPHLVLGKMKIKKKKCKTSIEMCILENIHLNIVRRVYRHVLVVSSIRFFIRSTRMIFQTGIFLQPTKKKSIDSVFKPLTCSITDANMLRSMPFDSYKITTMDISLKIQLYVQAEFFCIE